MLKRLEQFRLLSISCFVLLIITDLHLQKVFKQSILKKSNIYCHGHGFLLLFWVVSISWPIATIDSDDGRLLWKRGSF